MCARGACLEVSLETGQPFSELRRKQPPPYTVIEFGLTFADRAVLYRRLMLASTGWSGPGWWMRCARWPKRVILGTACMSGLGYLQIGYYLRAR